MTTGLHFFVARMRFAAFAAFMLLIFALATPQLFAATEIEAVRNRISTAAEAHKTGIEKLGEVEKSLVLLADFDQLGAIYLTGGYLLPTRFVTDHYQGGKNGRGFFFEKAQWNLLPATTADVEDVVNGFTAVNGGSFSSVATNDTKFGKRALSVTLARDGDGVKTTAIPVSFTRQLGHEKDVTLTASCWLKGLEGVKIRAEAQFVPKDAIDEKTKQPLADRKPDTSTPQVIVLDGNWQRVYCSVTGDSRITDREVVMQVVLDGAQGATVMMDGFQFEQTNFFGNGGNFPTTWAPGGEKLPSTSVSLFQPEVQKIFPVHAGTVSFWTRSPYREGAGWYAFYERFTPTWDFSDYIAEAGKSKDDQLMFCANMVAGFNDGQWHLMALSWDAEKIYLYKDGKLAGTRQHENVDMDNILRNFHLQLGGNISGQSGNAVMDDFAIFNRTLTADEIAALAASDQPLRICEETIKLGCGARKTFYRDEKSARLDIVMQGMPPMGAMNGMPGNIKIEAQMDILIGDMLADSQTVPLSYQQSTVTFDISPMQLKCGSYPCRVAITTKKNETAYTDFTIVIAPALRKDNYWLTSWDRGVGTEDWLKMFRNIGINGVDTGFTCGAELNRLGAEGFLFNWHYNFREGDYSPANRLRITEQTRAIAEELAPYPNWRGSLVNTETGPGAIPNAEHRKAWFDAYVKDNIGFPMPEKGWQFGTPYTPVGCAFPEGKKPGPDGIYTEEPESYKFINWWNNKGGVIWRLNALASEEMRKIRPDLRNWTDPVSFAGEADDLQGEASWSYSTSIDTIIAELEGAYGLAKTNGKDFYVTLGMDYCGGDWLNVTAPDDKKKYLAPTPDDAIQQAWVSVAHIPSDGLTYWDLDGWYYGMKGIPMSWNPAAGPMYAPPDSDVELGKVFKRDLLPLGAMIKGVPNAPRPLALLLPESTQWFDAVEGNWGWGTAHFPNHWKEWVGKSGIPHDIVMDNSITPGALAKYKVIIFPMAQYVSKKVNDELIAAAKGGTKIILDHYGKQTYPNMERWDQEYYYWISAEKQKVYGQETKQRLADMRRDLLPEMEAYAEGAESPVLLNVREYHGVKYVSVINNNKKAGPYTEWTNKPEFLPYGKAQQATVYIKAPQNSVVYEFTTSEKLPAEYKDGRLVVTLDLPPHAGRVLCVYPAEMTRAILDAPEKIKRGAQAQISIKLVNKQGDAVRGRQLFDATIVDADGENHDETGLYRVEDGKVTIPFRPALNDLPGVWRFHATERTTGLEVDQEIVVE